MNGDHSRSAPKNLGLRGAADSLTGKDAAPASFSPADLLNLLGIDRIGAQPAHHKPLHALTTYRLGEGRWDEQSGGGIAVKSLITLDGYGRLRALEIKLLCVQPDGRSTISKLVELGAPLAGRKQTIKRLSVLGRPVPVDQPDQVLRALGAIQHMHADMRNMALPQAAKIFDQFRISEILGEKIRIPGLSPQGGFDFQIPLASQDNGEPLLLPREFIGEMFLSGVNDLDPAKNFGAIQSRIGFDPENGNSFRHSAVFENLDSRGSLKAAINPLHKRRGAAIPDLLDMKWRAANDAGVNDNIALEKFVLMGQECCERAETRQKRLGIVNRANRDMRAGTYPALPDHIARYHQHELIDQRAFSEGIDRYPQLIIHSFGGESVSEYLPGIGGTIGGSCTGLFAYRRDPQGRVRGKGVLHDRGISFAKDHGKILAGEHGSFDYSMADLTDYKHLYDDVLLSHAHADHMQALIDDAWCGEMAGKTVHAAAYDSRVREVFEKKARVPHHLRPASNPLQGEGWLHITDGDMRVLSVFYATNAMPHSTNVTVYIVAVPPYLCDVNGRKIGKLDINPHYSAYILLGDFSGPPYCKPGYEGPVPPDTGFKRDAIMKFKAAMPEQFPDLPDSMLPTIDTIRGALCDGTAADKKGFGKDVVTAERNCAEFISWFPGKGKMINLLSTSKRMQEALFRVANSTQNHITGEGAYLEDRLTDMNVMGVNTDVIPRQEEGGNIPAYLEWHAARIGVEPVEYHKRSSQRMKEIIAATPEKVIILGTGSQGTGIEARAVGTQMAQGWSRLQLDPKYCKAAYGVDIRDFVISVRTAIHGNEEDQLRQIRQLAYENDLMVRVGIHNDSRLYNIKEPFYSHIIGRLEKLGLKYTPDESRDGMIIHNFYMEDSGHPCEEDYRQVILPWLKENNVDSIIANHFGKVESVFALHRLAEEADLKHTGEPVTDHTAWRITKKGYEIVARLTPALKLGSLNRRADKDHGGTRRYKRVSFAIGESGLQNSGLFAANDNKIYYSDLGIGGYDAASRDVTLPPVRRRQDFDQRMTRDAPALDQREHLPLRGPVPPRPRRDHPHLRRAPITREVA